MIKVAFVGWRGMVGSVLMERMRSENDFSGFAPSFYSTSQAGQPGPEVNGSPSTVRDANDTADLASADIVVTCQGSGYTRKIHPELRGGGWDGYWIDAASALRMAPEATIILDPVNRTVIDRALAAGRRDFIGGNCTVSLMLMAVAPLLQSGEVQWLTSMTYQAASGAGAKNMRELVAQMAAVAQASGEMLADPAGAILALDRQVQRTLTGEGFPTTQFGAPLAGSLIPWIDSAMPGGQTREEWKGMAETNKILQAAPEIPIDGICVRIGAMRCHSQALTLKLNRDLPLEEIAARIAAGNDWVDVVPNTRDATLARLSPAAVTGALTVPVGRLRKLTLGPEYLSLFTVGDQLLWGAAEPLRRMLTILLERMNTD
jgi:aspartate-semialdehyde dehydrogenase